MMRALRKRKGHAVPPGANYRRAVTLTLPVLVAIALAIAGCSETPEATVYKHGKYNGKPDNLPWQAQPFDGSKHDWELALDGRTQKQNEYGRIDNQ